MPTDKQPDKITLSGIKIFPRIGTTQEERAEPQVCISDITLRLNLAVAALSDKLENSVDYCKVVETVQKTAKAREYVLLESLTYAIVEAILEDFVVIDVNVRVRKRPAVLQGQLDFVETEVEKSSAGRPERAKYYDFS